MKVLNPKRWSLRAKLIASGTLVQLLVVIFVVASSVGLLQGSLLDQASLHTRQVVSLLEQTIAVPLAQRDYATIQQTLDNALHDEAVDYLVLKDHRGQIIAASGWNTAKPLPPRDVNSIDLQRADMTLHVGAPIGIAGQNLGEIYIGLSTEKLRLARNEFLLRSIGLAMGAILVSALLLATIAFAITRHLRELTLATRQVADGDFNVLLSPPSQDEIGQLASVFNKMALALKQRIAALQESEDQQRLHLKVAQEEQARLTSLLEAMNSGILFVDSQGYVSYSNASFCRIWSMPELPTRQHLDQLVPLLRSQTSPDNSHNLDAMLQLSNVPGIASDGELRTLDGRIISQRMQVVKKDAVDVGRIWFHEDITEERQIQQRAYQALQDPLTRLMNRRGLYESLQAAISRAAHNAAQFALLFIDLDDFKYANDVGGHRTGDAILVSVARALSEQLRGRGIVARLGGDEFAVLLTVSGSSEATDAAADVVKAVAALRFAVNGATLRVGCSVGVAIYPKDAQTQADLMASADTAMYQAKQSGKNGWVMYKNDPGRLHANLAKISWNERINQALIDNRLVLHYQAVHSAANLRVAHYEVLLRIVDEEDESNMLLPADFIRHAERNGRILQIDRWVLNSCIEQLAVADSAVRLAANVSARSLEDETFPVYVRATLEKYAVDPRRLLIELTETSAIGDSAAAVQMIAGLKKIGCAIFLDDFGCGFSSFAQLKILDVDAIKIDGSFIRNLAADKSNQLFVESMIKIAHCLGKTVVAEHVEDIESIEILRRLGIDLLQGFYFGTPSATLTNVSVPIAKLAAI